MKHLLLITTLLFSVSSYSDDLADFDADSKQAIKEFAMTLKSALLTAMKSGGSVEAITVCNTVAPSIAETLSNKYGFEIGRTSLKVRNPDNKADEWESGILQQFEDRKQQGEAINTLSIVAKHETENQSYFRKMKAIPIDKACLICHGTQISTQTKSMLDTHYPNDQAIGYKLGDIRGAFTVKKAISD